jgi:hypothetical protein
MFDRRICVFIIGFREGDEWDGYNGAKRHTRRKCSPQTGLGFGLFDCSHANGTLNDTEMAKELRRRCHELQQKKDESSAQIDRGCWRKKSCRNSKLANWVMHLVTKS